MNKQEITIFDEKVEFDLEQIEIGRLAREFERLAREQRSAAMACIDKAAENIDDFCQNGNRWARRFIDKIGDLAAKEVIEMGIYDFDKSVFLNELFTAKQWESAFSSFCNDIHNVDEEEANREYQRQVRSMFAKDDTVGEMLTQGFKNLAGRGIYAVKNASVKNGIFNEHRMNLVNAIYETIRTACIELAQCLQALGHPMDVKSALESAIKAERLFNNLKEGKIPSAVRNSIKAQIFALNPYFDEFYEWVYEKDGDANGDLRRAADVFGVSLDAAKSRAFKKQLGECKEISIEGLKSYRKRAETLGNELGYDASETIAEIDGRLRDLRQRIFKEKLGRCSFGTIEEAKAYGEKATILAHEYDCDASEELKMVSEAISQIEQRQRTAFGKVYSTLDAAKEARGSREGFFSALEHAVKEADDVALYSEETAPKKKLLNARAYFPIPIEERVIALNDTTIGGSCKRGLAITYWGLRWKNSFTTPTQASAISWEELAKCEQEPRLRKDEITIVPGGVFDNVGSSIGILKIYTIIKNAWRWCREATFFTDKSPYEPPKKFYAQQAAREEASSSGIVQTYISGMKKYAKFSGRCSRRDYWTFFLMNFAIVVALAFVSMGILGLIYLIGAMVPLFSAMVRRFHDMGKSGWLTLVGFVPVVGTTIVFLMMFKEGTPGENQYGPMP